MKSNLSGASPQRRLSNIPLANPYGSACWAQYQPYIIHTTDEFFKVTAAIGVLESTTRHRLP